MDRYSIIWSSLWGSLAREAPDPKLNSSPGTPGCTLQGTLSFKSQQDSEKITTRVEGLSQAPSLQGGLRAVRGGTTFGHSESNLGLWAPKPRVSPHPHPTQTHLPNLVTLNDFLPSTGLLLPPFGTDQLAAANPSSGGGLGPGLGPGTDVRNPLPGRLSRRRTSGG